MEFYLHVVRYVWTHAGVSEEQPELLVLVSEDGKEVQLVITSQSYSDHHTVSSLRGT